MTPDVDEIIRRSQRPVPRKPGKAGIKWRSMAELRRKPKPQPEMLGSVARIVGEI
jgi:hypothetical protein